MTNFKFRLNSKEVFRLIFRSPIFKWLTH